jgi:glucose-6-phosphate isomerase
MKVIEPRLWHKIPEGVIEGAGVQYNKKYLKDVKNIYSSENIGKYDQETLVYEVYSYGEGDLLQQGNLYWGLTILQPVYIDGECNMTRGHFHEDRNCVEYYFGIEGEGLLLLMKEDGEMWAEKIMPGSLHYINGNLAHRIVNTGETILKVGACWPTNAGHDYTSTEKSKFPFKIYKIDGVIKFIKR